MAMSHGSKGLVDMIARLWLRLEVLDRHDDCTIEIRYHSMLDVRHASSLEDAVSSASKCRTESAGMKAQSCSMSMIELHTLAPMQLRSCRDLCSVQVVRWRH